jgi:hypothetical protein
MFIIDTRHVELAFEFGGIYLRLGRRDFHWSRETGLTL